MDGEAPVGSAERPGTPDADADIGVDLVRRLLVQQHPDLARLPLVAIPGGWDNEILRLGDELAVRLPRRLLSVRLVEHEQRWLPEIAPHLPLPIPAPVRVGRATDEFPWRWSIVPWLPGRPADQAPPSAHQAPVLARFLRALHRPGPSDAPDNPFRGVPLAARDADTRRRLEALLIVENDAATLLEEVWDDALEAAAADEAVWLHGDLHPRNVLVDAGRLSAVIDWGDITVGDPATDLASAWMLFDSAQIQAFRDAYGPGNEALWRRARGWAAYFATVFLQTGLVDNDRFLALGRRTVRRLGNS